MGRPKYTYNYDHDTDTTTITSAEKINGKIVTTTKTVEGNQTPEKSNTAPKIILGLIVLGSLNTLLMVMPQIIVTPVAVFGALKLTKNKKTNEKVIAGVGAGVLSLIACSIFFKPPMPSPTSSYSSSNDNQSKVTAAWGEGMDTLKRLHKQGKITNAEKEEFWARIDALHGQAWDICFEADQTAACNEATKDYISRIEKLKTY